jgi:hypothetical protein
MAEALDREIGRLFDSLKAIKRFDSTDFIFIGDNGSDARVYQGDNRAKGSVYQDGVSVPFIVSGPSVINPGRISNALINTQDIFATVLELFGFTNWKDQIPSSKPVDSKSLLPIIRQEKESIRDWVFTEVFKNTPAQFDGKTMRNLNYKLIDFDNGTQKYFNLTNDPTENTDLLLRTLNQVEKDNYAYLCQEMTKLVGKGGFCITTGLDNSQDGMPECTYENQHDIIRVFFDHTGEASVTCISSTGNRMFQYSHLYGPEHVFSTASLPSGMYTLLISRDGKETSHSFIVQR